MAGQLDTSLRQEVVMKVEVTSAVEVVRVLLCLGEKLEKPDVGALVGMLLSVADVGAIGPFRRPEVRMVLLGAGPKSPPPWISSSTFAQS